MFADPKKRLGLLLVLPALIFIVVCFLLPVLALLVDAFRVGDGMQWGVDRFIDFFSQEFNRTIFWRTLRIAALVTLAAILLGYPAAQAVARVSPKWRGLVVGMMILPLMVSPIARTYAWIVLLGRNGAVNAALVNMGFTEEPLRLLFSEFAVFVGLLQLLLPLMSLAGALENLPRDVEPAAATLGANPWQVFCKVTLPLTQEGLVVGGTLVFTGCVTAYVTPALLGGTKVLMLETLLYQKVSVESDFGAANVIAVILVCMTLLVNAGLKRISSSRSSV